MSIILKYYALLNSMNEKWETNRAYQLRDYLTEHE